MVEVMANTLPNMQSGLWNDQMMAAFNQQSAMQNAAQNNMIGGLTGFHNLSQLAGIGTGRDHYIQTSYRPFRPIHGLARRKFMQRTRSGLKARKVTEVLFWIVAAFTLIGAIMVPVAIKAMTFFWQWALT